MASLDVGRQVPLLLSSFRRCDVHSDTWLGRLKHHIVASVKDSVRILSAGFGTFLGHALIHGVWIEAGQPEVSYLNTTIEVNKQIGRLNISMQNAGILEEVHGA